MNHGYVPMIGNPQNNREYGIYLFLVFCGLAGLAILKLGVSNVSQNNLALPEKSLVSTSPSHLPSPPTVAAAAATTVENDDLKPKESLFVPNDYLEAQLEAVFTLNNMCKGVEYELELGKGGPRKPFKNGKLRHTFSKEGDITITLYGTYEGATKAVQQRDFYVNRAIELDIAAEAVDR